MHNLEVVLIYVGVPVAVIMTIIGVVVARSATGGWRYRPGRPFSFTPVWLGDWPGEASDQGGLPRSPGERGEGKEGGGGASGRW